jgi:hypothetical protein
LTDRQAEGPENLWKRFAAKLTGLKIGSAIEIFPCPFQTDFGEPIAAFGR